MDTAARSVKKSKNHKIYKARILVLPSPCSLLTGSWLCFAPKGMFSIAAAALYFILLRITAFSRFSHGFAAFGPPIIGPPKTV